MTNFAPGVDILHTYFNSGMSQHHAIAEFVDNSFGEAAGNASTFSVIVHGGKSLMFIDDGNGVESIDLLFKLAGGQSKHSASDIGKFGVGSKYGALVFGTKVTVETIRNGEYHKYWIDWADVLASGEWHTKLNGKSLPMSKAPKFMKGKGTCITVSNFYPKRNIRTRMSLADDLGLVFSQALHVGGKSIQIVKVKSVNLKTLDLDKLDFLQVQPVYGNLDVSTPVSFNGLIDGKSFSVAAGALSEWMPKYSGIHIAFGGRTILHLTKLGTKALPKKLFAMVALSNSWKDSLNFNKTEITEDKEELEALLYSLLSKLIRDLTEEKESKHKTIVLKALELNLSKKLNNIITGHFGTKPGIDGPKAPGSNKTKGGGPGGKSIKDPIVSLPDVDIDDAYKGSKSHASHNSLKLVVSLSDELGLLTFKSDLSFTGKSAYINVQLNDRCPSMFDAFTSPVNGIALNLVCSAAVTNAILNSEADIQTLIPDLFTKYKIEGDNPDQVYLALFSEILDGLDVVNEPSIKEVSA